MEVWQEQGRGCFEHVWMPYHWLAILHPSWCQGKSFFDAYIYLLSLILLDANACTVCTFGCYSMMLFNDVNKPHIKVSSLSWNKTRNWSTDTLNKHLIIIKCIARLSKTTGHFPRVWDVREPLCGHVTPLHWPLSQCFSMSPFLYYFLSLLPKSKGHFSMWTLGQVTVAIPFTW